MKLARDTREAVRRRARDACEYCRLPQAASILPHQVDHIIASQHGGADSEENLCLCCLRCNLKKGPNIASMDPMTGLIVALFHPRRHSWRDHFRQEQDGTVSGLTPEGRATAALLGMNEPERAQLRAALILRGQLP